MFTGIIEEIGTILRCEQAGLVIQAAQVLQGIETKDSIAVDGACLTVTGRGEDWVRVDVMPETLPCTQQHTNLGEIQPGTLLNLETDIIGRYVVHLLELTGIEAPGSGNAIGETAIRDIVSAALASLQERRKLPISPLAW